MRVAMFQLLVETVQCARAEAYPGVSRLMTEVIQAIKRRPEEEFRLEDLARLARLSLGRFKVRFKAETGVSPRQFIMRAKVEAAEERLRSGRESIGQIALDLGFPTSQYFATVFRRFTGQNPKTFRREADLPKGPSHRADDGQG
jgi:AraC-like DNA-binding protein